MIAHNHLALIWAKFLHIKYNFSLLMQVIEKLGSLSLLSVAVVVVVVIGSKIYLENGNQCRTDVDRFQSIILHSSKYPAWGQLYLPRGQTGVRYIALIWIALCSNVTYVANIWNHHFSNLMFCSSIASLAYILCHLMLCTLIVIGRLQHSKNNNLNYNAGRKRLNASKKERHCNQTVH